MEGSRHDSGRREGSKETRRPESSSALELDFDARKEVEVLLADLARERPEALAARLEGLTTASRDMTEQQRRVYQIVTSALAAKVGGAMRRDMDKSSHRAAIPKPRGDIDAVLQGRLRSPTTLMVVRAPIDVPSPRVAFNGAVREYVAAADTAHDVNVVTRLRSRSKIMAAHLAPPPPKPVAYVAAHNKMRQHLASSAPIRGHADEELHDRFLRVADGNALKVPRYRSPFQMPTAKRRCDDDDE
jgi:hypothetical protein